ncbi:hypothetical protein [Gimesia fumaroli]|uniref:Uncharacterized protein n=1 Tax=Gimesia fumaroli TaxID=2527976 RepID=A0A518IK93_9PLAN|nr:hypothetical protein [Gimesia fumaroli]QDV53508.1 hypothetical protein Enr17x_55830 [Gimesia fumaroli]
MNQTNIKYLATFLNFSDYDQKAFTDHLMRERIQQGLKEGWDTERIAISLGLSSRRINQILKQEEIAKGGRFLNSIILDLFKNTEEWVTVEQLEYRAMQHPEFIELVDKNPKVIKSLLLAATQAGILASDESSYRKVQSEFFNPAPLSEAEYNAKARRAWSIARGSSPDDSKTLTVKLDQAGLDQLKESWESLKENPFFSDFVRLARRSESRAKQGAILPMNCGVLLAAVPTQSSHPSTIGGELLNAPDSHDIAFLPALGYLDQEAWNTFVERVLPMMQSQFETMAKSVPEPDKSAAVKDYQLTIMHSRFCCENTPQKDQTSKKRLSLSTTLGMMLLLISSLSLHFTQSCESQAEKTLIAKGVNIGLNEDPAAETLIAKGVDIGLNEDPAEETLIAKGVDIGLTEDPAAETLIAKGVDIGLTEDPVEETLIAKGVNIGLTEDLV